MTRVSVLSLVVYVVVYFLQVRIISATKIKNTNVNLVMSMV